MKFRGFVLFVFVALIGLVAAYYPPKVDNAQKEAILIQTILDGLKQLHYNPVELDDEFSSKLHNIYLERLDGGKRWLTQNDIDQLDQYKDLLDNEANQGTYDFLTLSIDLKQKGIEKTEKFFQEILATPMDFTTNEIVEMDGEKKSYAKNDAELKAYWEKSLKYDVLSRLVEKIETQEKKIAEEKDKLEGKVASTVDAVITGSDSETEDKEEEEFIIKTEAELEQESREAVLKVYSDWYSRLAKKKRKDHLSDYLKAFSNVFDPHTEYFLPVDKENFDMSMSGRLEGIGARLQETIEEGAKVVSIVPGGPAWQGKVLEVNDLIQKVAQDKDGEWVDVTGWTINDVVQKIRGKKGTKVRLTLKKVDGAIVETIITRDEIIMDEGFAKSSILDIPDAVDNIGYIHLPRFYADFRKSDGRQCAVDVEKEIAKLKEENVNGIILDLRNNGGGSLRDVVDMSGLFIEQGPIVQVKSREAAAEVLSDRDASVQYDGPLIVMVNSFSASASEILAAALQDYDRAVIVGSDATFGKATVQRFFNLDRAIRGHSEIKPLGEIKLTMQKFYRIDGSSNQLKGVQPDIVFPEIYDQIKTGEQEYETAMTWSEIESVPHSQSVYHPTSMSSLKAASTSRIAQNTTFQKVKENATRLKTQRDKTTYSLNMDEYRAFKKKQKAEADKYKDLFDEAIPGMNVRSLDADKDYINEDESRKARFDDFLEGLTKDAYLEETLYIMKDMIK